MSKEEFKKLFDEYFDPIRNYLFYRCGNKELASDIAQDAFMRVWEKQFDVSSNKIKSLLYKIASDLFVSSYRRKVTDTKFTNSISLDLVEHAPDKGVEYQELKEMYERALSKMAEKQRTVFLMSRVEELKYSDIAERLDISVKAVEKRMSKSLSYLRKELIS